MPGVPLRAGFLNGVLPMAECEKKNVVYEKRTITSLI